MDETDKATGAQSDEALQGLLKKDMAYGDLRKVVLTHGWEPLPDPQCRANVIGGDEKTCVANPDLAICRACTDIKELSGYSGDGYALTRFRNTSGQQLEVTSYGMIEDWNASDADSRLRVTEWKVLKAGASP